MSETAIPRPRHNVLGVMAKYWTPGQVKTRLARSIGFVAAAEIHRQFVLHLAESLQTAADRRIFAVAPTARFTDFQSALPGNEWEIATQPDGDLGRRIEKWFKDSLLPTESSASILIGADCPGLNQADIDQAFQRLADQDVVLGPASDGGYYLIGLRGPWRDQYVQLLDDIPWSSEKVFERTVSRIEQAGLSLALLSEREDIDTINELNRLRASLSSEQREQRLASMIDAILGDR